MSIGGISLGTIIILVVVFWLGKRYGAAVFGRLGMA
jgi:hypothetical protein